MEHMEKRVVYDEEMFEKADADASFTTTEQAGRLHKGDCLMIRGRPCKVADVSLKAPGKHGAAKCHFVGKDIFTGDKMEIIIPAHAQADVPVVVKKEYMVMYPENVAPGYFVSLMDLATCTTRADLKLPDAATELMTRITDAVATGEDKEVALIVLASCGMEQIIDLRIKAV